jgi:serine/threonine-protein kinase
MIDPLVGQTLGQYELQDRLGRGGMAAVYRAVQPALGRSVAVKVLPLSQVLDPTLPERFRREARMAANLLHPNIVPVYDFGEWQGYLFIVMALITGGTLKERIHAPMPIDAAVRFVAQAADALGYAHGQGIFHRDVKPTNVLLAAGDWAMLSDFGIARALGETTRLTSPYGTIGTPAYMAPEQWLGGDVDSRADLYSLGIVLYELLAGSPPFTATTSEGLMRQHLEMPMPALATRRPDLPVGFEDVVQTALAKDPARRYRHAGELKAALEAAQRPAPAPHSVSETDLAAAGRSPTTSPYLGQTLRVPDQPSAPAVHVQQSRGGGTPTGLLPLMLVLAVLLAGAVGYVAASGRFESRVSPSPTRPVEIAAPVAPITPTPPPVAPTPTAPPPPTAAPTAAPTSAPTAVPTVPPTVTSLPPTPVPPAPAAPLTPAPTSLPTPAPVPPKPTIIQPTAPAKVPPTAPSTAPPTPASRENQILAPTNGATVPAEFTVRGARRRPLPVGAHLWLLIKADVPVARWYPCWQGERVPRPDGSWECSVTLGVPSGYRVELRVGVVDDTTNADLNRRLAPAGQPNRTLYPDQQPGYLPPSFVEEARVIVTRQ